MHIHILYKHLQASLKKGDVLLVYALRIPQIGKNQDSTFEKAYNLSR